jgi:tonB-dependent receptor
MPSKFFLSIFVLFINYYYSQNIEGFVIDNESKKPIQNVKIYTENSDNWILTDKDGKFSINIKNDKIIILNKSGYQEQQWKVESNLRPVIPLISAEIRIKGIEIIGKKRNFSEIYIKEETIKNNQTFSLSDVLTQLPGQFVKPIDNNTFKNIVFRTASGQGINSNNIQNINSYGNKALGISILVNDIALSNNENMQSYSSPYSPVFNNTSRRNLPLSSQPNYGVDLREIPVGDIENIKIIQGIPDAKYGDLTSGLIIVETKSGKKPLQINTSLQQGNYQLDISKGFNINKKGNAINILLSYMNANPDLRNQLTSYERIIGKILFETLNNDKSIRNRININLSANIDNGSTDTDSYEGIFVKNSKRGFFISDNLKIKFKNIFIDGINANIGFQYDKQTNVREQFINLGARPFGTANENAIYYAKYTPVAFMTRQNIEGIPINFNTNIEGYKMLTTHKKWIHNLSFGGNIKYGNNIGRGRYGSSNSAIITSSSNPAENGFRDYNFAKNVNSNIQYSLFLQDNIKKYIKNKNLLMINIGGRLDLQNAYTTISPRINISLKYHKTTLRGGFGLTTKAPTLNQLYTGNRYLDYLIGDYRVPNKYSIAIMQTIVTQGNNIKLKPSKSWKTEIGIDLNLPFVNIYITGYYNRLFDGFTNITKVKTAEISDVKIHQHGDKKPTYEIVGKHPFIYQQNHITNGLNSTDKGIELGINFKKINPLNLEIGINTSYVKTINNSTVKSISPSKTLGNISYGVFQSTGNTSEMANINGNFAYHLPKVGLILSLQTNTFLLDNFFTDAQSKYPIGYYDNSGNYHSIPENERTEAKYNTLYRDNSETTAQKLGKVLTNLHLRVTKDFINGFQASFYIYNILNSQPTKRSLDNGSIETYTFFVPTSFGASLNYKF